MSTTQTSSNFLALGFTLALSIGVNAAWAQAASPSGASDAAFAEARAWIAAKIDAQPLSRQAQPGLYVITNHDPVHLDQRSGHPLVIGDWSFVKGLYCHAPSRLLVRLPSPAKQFTAIVGLDHNNDTAHGRGSVVFSVAANEKEFFRSEVLRYGSAPVHVSADLDGASEFTLDISDAGDGIGWDQSDWGDAKVTLQDGTTIFVSDLPFHAAPPKEPYSTTPPFSFIYANKPVAEQMAGWKVDRTRSKLDNARTSHTTIYHDPATGLTTTCDAIAYADFPIVEWTIHLKNEGQRDTPIISSLQGIDTSLSRAGTAEFVLHHAQGSVCRADDFQPLTTTLAPASTTRIAPVGGRPSDAAMPYFNLQWEGEGVILAVGWPGQWSASFVRDEGNAVRIIAGQELTSFVLHPGESARSPLIVLQFTDGDVIASQNVWRRWMIAHNLPRPGGKPIPANHMACSSHQFNEMLNANEANQKQFIDAYAANDMKPNYWWMDAGWYPNNGGWWNTGTWEVDRSRFPGGLRAVTDHAHALGVKSIVWFEPERVNRATWLYEQRPQWLLGTPGDESRLLDLGNPEARAWLTDHVDALLTSEGIDLYRQDFNFPPLAFWRGHDAPDRQGLTEMRHVEGYLAYWDELRRRHPDMPIDTCASGGRRLDLETLRRSVPLLRSDHILEPIGQQCHTFGLSSWVPYYGTGWNQFDAYSIRSEFCSSLTTCYDMRRADLDLSVPRAMLGQWREHAACLLGDFYPLTPYTLADDLWIAWQFDLPGESRGIVQAFRRPRSPYESLRVQLHGLDAAATYEVHDLDEGSTHQATGRDLAQTGVLISLSGAPSSALIAYKRVP